MKPSSLFSVPHPASPSCDRNLLLQRQFGVPQAAHLQDKTAGYLLRHLMNQAVKGGRLPRVVGLAKRAAILGADVGAGPASEVPPEVAEAARAGKIKAPWDCKESIRDSGREGHESSKAESDPRRGMRGQLTRKQRDEPSKALDAQEAAAKKRLPHRTVGFGGKVYGVPRGRALRRWRSKGGPLAGPLLSDMRMSLNAARLAGVGVPGPDLGLRGLRGTGERRSRGLGVTGTRERALTAGQNKAGAIPETASACGAPRGGRFARTGREVRSRKRFDVNALRRVGPARATLPAKGLAANPNPPPGRRCFSADHHSLVILAKQIARAAL